jgi:hypothetical protein
MDNFLFGAEGLFVLMRIELAFIFESEVLRGFLGGYIVATLIYGFIITSNRHRRHMCELGPSSVKKKKK